MSPEKLNSNNETSNLDQQESINIAWDKILSKFPVELQQEFREERPNPNKEDIEWFGSFRLLAPDPDLIPLRELLRTNENTILRSPPDVIEEINKKWGTAINANLSKVYDQNPDRVRKYSLMSSETSRPSVLVDGEVMFGIGRFKAALLRKYSDLRVWKLSTKQ